MCIAGYCQNVSFKLEMIEGEGGGVPSEDRVGQSVMAWMIIGLGKESA